MWTRSKLEELLKAGKIRGISIPLDAKPTEAGRIVAKHYAKGNKAKDWIGRTLLSWCELRCVKLIEEYQFDTVRKFRSDYAIPAYKILVEYEGIFSEGQNGHTGFKHYTKDTNKYNLAAMNGFKVLRYTNKNYKDLEIDLEKITL